MILNSLFKFLKLSCQRGKNILILILVLIILANLFSFLNPKNKNQWDLVILKTKFAFAQVFFPRYPTRIKYIIGELYQTNEELVYLNQELKRLTEECSCENAVSQCGRKAGLTPPSRRDIELNPAVINVALTDPASAMEGFGKELSRVKNQVSGQIDNLNIYLKITKQKKVSETGIKDKIIAKIKTLAAQIGSLQPIKDIKGRQEEKLKNIGDALKNIDIRTDVRFNPSEITNIEERIEDLKNLESDLKEEENKLKDLKNEVTGLTELPRREIENKLRQAESRLQSKINAVTQLPDQLIGKLTQITEDLKQQITSLPESIKSLLTPFGCEAGSPEAFGEACPQRKEIEKIQVEIRNNVDQVSFLRNLLEKEMETGLKAELETLREDEAKELENNLNETLAFSEKIIGPSLANIEILNNEEYSTEKQCRAECEEGIPLGFSACILDNLGEQSPITLEFEVTASLDKIELGEIGIKGLRLNLPEKIDLSDFQNFEDYKIHLPDLGINFPPIPIDDLEGFSMPPVVIYPPSPSLPRFPLGEFSCPQFGPESSATYYCPSAEEQEPMGYIPFKWYLRTFGWLSEKCQEIPTMKGQYGAPIKGKFEQCLDKDNVHLTILKECDILWQQYLACLDDPDADCVPPPGVCKPLEAPSARPIAVQQECQKLFNQEGETPPFNCDLDVLKNKCSQLKAEGREDAPEPCFFLPLFTKKLEEPGSKAYQGGQITCPSQTLFDNPGAGFRLDCPLNFPTIPNLQLPDIIIPDLILPSFSFMPFLKVKLPSFIFEDLLFSQLNLCNLDNCRDLIPPIGITIPYPVLNIPAIDIPSIEAILSGLPDVPELQGTTLPIEIDRLEFPPIPIPLPELNLMNLISLEMQIPEIPIPFPDITVNFKGLNIEVLNMLLGLVSKIIDIPTGCIDVGIEGLPLVIALPDYYFSWSKFPMPEIPDLCNNEHIQINDFCQDVKETIDEEVLEKIAELQETINQLVQEELQSRLDEIALDLNETIEEHITLHLEKIKSKIEQGIEKHLTRYIEKLKSEGEQGVEEKTKRDIIREGMLHIPPAKISLEEELEEELGEIEIPMEEINEKLAKIPQEIEIPWPEELKDIKIKKPITYQLPPIPFDGLSYTKWIEIDVPGFQYDSLQLSIDFLGSYGSCEGLSPSGGNPYPINEIKANLEEVVNINRKVSDFSEKINQVLE